MGLECMAEAGSREWKASRDKVPLQGMTLVTTALNQLLESPSLLQIVPPSQDQVFNSWSLSLGRLC